MRCEGQGAYQRRKRFAPSGLDPARTEGFDIPGLEFREALPDGFGRPVPPCDLRHLRRDRAKPADLRVAHHAARTEIGIIAELGIFDRGVTQNLAATADGRLAQFDRGFDDGFGELRTRLSRLVHVDGSSSIRQPGAAGNVIYHGAVAVESERWDWQACAGRG